MLVDSDVTEIDVAVVVDVVDSVVVVVGLNVVLVRNVGVEIVAALIEPDTGEYGDERMPTKAASMISRSANSLRANFNLQTSSRTTVDPVTITQPSLMRSGEPANLSPAL